MKPTAHRTAVANLVFNAFGVLLFLPILSEFSNAVVDYSGNPSLAVAWVQLIFNLVVTIATIIILRLFGQLIPNSRPVSIRCQGPVGNRPSLDRERYVS